MTTEPAKPKEIVLPSPGARGGDVAAGRGAGGEGDGRPDPTPTTHPLPPGWRWARLGDHVSKVGSGLTPRGGQSTYLKAGIPLVRSQNVHPNRFNPDGLAYITPKQDAEMAGSRVIPDDVLLNITGASIGRACVVPAELCPANVNQHVAIIRCLDTIHPEYLSHYISTSRFQRYITAIEAGATRQALTKAIIENFPIPLPPLPEQRRIAAVLGVALDAVRRAREAALARLEAARAFPAAFLRSVFESEEAQTWPPVRLGDVCSFKNGLNFTAGETGYSLKVVGVKDFQQNTYVPMDSLDEVSLAAPPGAESLLQGGDLLFVRSNGSADLVGRSMIVREVDSPVSFSGFTIRARLEDKRVDPLFCAHLLKSTDIGEKMKGVGRGVNIRNLSQGILREIQIPLPPIEMQQVLVKEIELVPERAARVTALAEAELASIDALPQSLLREAFAGEL